MVRRAHHDIVKQKMLLRTGRSSEEERGNSRGDEFVLGRRSTSFLRIEQRQNCFDKILRGAVREEEAALQAHLFRKLIELRKLAGIREHNSCALVGTEPFRALFPVADGERHFDKRKRILEEAVADAHQVHRRQNVQLVVTDELHHQILQFLDTVATPNNENFHGHTPF